MVKVRSNFFITFLFTLVFASYIVFAPSPYFFKGIVHVNGSLAPNGTVIEAFIPVNASTPVSAVTIGEGQLSGLDPGKYVISFEANPGDTVSFKVNGIGLITANGTNVTNQTLGTEQIITNFNLSVNKSANSAACTFAAGCTGGFCVHNICRSASTFCGDGFCDASESCSSDDSACSSGQACTNGCVATAAGAAAGGGGGGGGGGPALPSTTETVNVVSANTPVEVPITVAALPVTQVELTSSVTVTNVQVTVKEVLQPSGVSAPVLAAEGNVYKYIDITTTGVTNAQLTDAKIKFKVPKSWFINNSIDPATVALYRLSANVWTKLSTTRVSEDALNVHYEADTPGFSAFAIAGEKAAAPPTFAVCGNNVLESGEECDEQQLAGQTCQTRGFAGGTLKCTNCRFDTSACFTEAPPAPPEEVPPAPPAPKPIQIPDIVILVVILVAVLLLGYYYYSHRKGHQFSWVEKS